MQKGALSLMQMAKTVQALAALDEAGVLTISLITDPTYGGVAASFATSCDVIVAEPQARLGFAGPRVIKQVLRQSLPPGFQRRHRPCTDAHSAGRAPQCPKWTSSPVASRWSAVPTPRTPERGFIPTPGLLRQVVLPDGPFTRVDTHVFPGYEVPPSYDSLIAKLVVWGPDRPQATAPMARALDELRVTGPGVRTARPGPRRRPLPTACQLGEHR